MAESWQRKGPVGKKEGIIKLSMQGTQEGSPWNKNNPLLKPWGRDKAGKKEKAESIQRERRNGTWFLEKGETKKDRGRTLRTKHELGGLWVGTS